MQMTLCSIVDNREVARARTDQSSLAYSLDHMVQVKPGRAYLMAAFDQQGNAIGDGEFSYDAAEGKEMRKRYDAYHASEGKLLEAYFGRQVRPLVGSGKLPPQAAAGTTQLPSGEVLIFGNRQYLQKVDQIARDHGLSQAEANRYVLAHEHTHALDPERESRSTIDAEKYVEHHLSQYFGQRAAESAGAKQSMYRRLQATAQQRLKTLNGMTNAQYEQGVRPASADRESAPSQYQQAKAA